MEHHYQESCFTIMVNLNAEIQPRILDRFVSYFKQKSKHFGSCGTQYFDTTSIPCQACEIQGKWFIEG